MAQINAGRVRFISRGEYNSSTQYYVFDFVNYNGNSYFAKQNTQGNLPTNTTYWQLVAEKGNVGSIGPTGNGISTVAKTGTSGLVDTYTITFTNGNTTTFTVANGNGVDRIELTSTSGAVKTYTIYYTNGTTSTFDVTDGEVTQEQLDETNEEVERAKMVYNALPKVSGEGTELTLNNTAECPVYDIELSPSALEQATTTGKNLLNCDITWVKSINTSGTWTDNKYVLNGITYTFVYENNQLLYVNVNGTSTVDHNIAVGRYRTINAGTYTGSGSPANGSSSTYRMFFDYLGGDDGTGAIGTISANVLTIGYIYVYNGTTVNNLKFYPMLEIGNSLTPYEPYTGGQPSPSPSYPQTIHTISGDNNVNICGKNLFDKNNTMESGWYNNEGVFSDSISTWHTTQKYNIIPNETYILSGNKISYNDVYAISQVYFYDEDKNWISRTKVTSNDFSFTTPVNCYFIDYQLVYSGYTYNYNNVKDDIRLDKDAPQTYPITLPVENILNNTATTITTNHVTFTVNEDKSITINGTPSADTNIVLDTISFVSGEMYTISGVTGYTDTTLQLYTSSSTAFPSGNRLQSFNGAVTRTAQANETCSVKLYVYSGITYNNVTIYPQIEKGSKANSYTPYGTTPLEYCEIGNAKDLFFKNVVGSEYYDSTLVEDKWYLKKNVGKTILDGSENWNTNASWNYTNTNNYYTNLGLSNDNLISSHFTYNSGTYTLDTNGIMQRVWTTQLLLRIDNTIASDTDAFKTWLSTHNTTVYYILATPTYTLLNNTLQTQLDNLAKAISYQEQTNVSQTNNALPFVIKLSAIRDMSGIFELIL